MFFRRKKPSAPPLNTSGMIPVIRASICTGEQVAGLKDPATGKIREVSLIRTPADLREFAERCGVEEQDIKLEY